MTDPRPATDERDPADAGPGGAEEVGFGAAMDELERIVAELESDELDVDLLAERVERAAQLVTLCRERIDAARFRVEEVLVRLDEGDED